MNTPEQQEQIEEARDKAHRMAAGSFNDSVLTILSASGKEMPTDVSVASSLACISQAAVSIAASLFILADREFDVQ